MRDIDHKYTDEITCPYCGGEFTDSWEIDGDDGDCECSECGKEFGYQRIVSVCYVTCKDD